MRNDVSRRLRATDYPDKHVNIKNSVLITFFANDFTGANKMGCKFASALVDCGFIVHALCGKTRSELDAELLGALEKTGCRLMHIENYYDPRYLLNYLKVLWIMNRLRPAFVIPLHQKDFIFGASLKFLFWSKFIPSIQNRRSFSGNKNVRNVKRFLHKINSIYSDLLLCCSGLVKNESINEFGVPRHKTTLLFNSVPILDAYQRTIKADGKFIFANIGRIDRQKGQLRIVKSFLNAFQNDRERKLWLIGDVSIGANGATLESEDYKKEVLDFIAMNDHCSQIRVLGWRQDIQGLLRQINAYVQPSKWEGLSLAVLEAMESGLPVIISDRMEIPVGFNNQFSGYVVSNENELEIALKTVVGLSYDELIKVAEVNQSIVRNYYSDEVTMTRFTNLLKSMEDDDDVKI